MHALSALELRQTSLPSRRCRCVAAVASLPSRRCRRVAAVASLPSHRCRRIVAIAFSSAISAPPPVLSPTPLPPVCPLPPRAQVELIFDEDAGLYPAIRKLVATSKCPIVLTCNELPEALAEPQLAARVLTYDRPTEAQLVRLGLEVCAARGVTIREAELCQIIQFEGRDPRKMLNVLQCWASPAIATAAGTAGAAADGAAGAPSSATKAIGCAAGVTLERLLALSSVCGGASLGELLTRRAEIDGDGDGHGGATAACTLQAARTLHRQSTALADAWEYFGRSPLLEHPVRLLDVRCDGRLLGADACQQTLQGAVTAAVGDAARDGGDSADHTDPCDVAAGGGDAGERVRSRATRRSTVDEEEIDEEDERGPSKRLRAGSAKARRVLQDTEEAGGEAAAATEGGGDVSKVAGGGTMGTVPERTAETVVGERRRMECGMEILECGAGMDGGELTAAAAAGGEAAAEDGVASVEPMAVEAEGSPLPVTTTPMATAAAGTSAAVSVAEGDVAEAIDAQASPRGEALMAPTDQGDVTAEAPAFLPPAHSWSYPEASGQEQAAATAAATSLATTDAKEAASAGAFDAIDATATLLADLSAAAAYLEAPAGIFGPTDHRCLWEELPQAHAQRSGLLSASLQASALARACARLPSTPLPPDSLTGGDGCDSEILARRQFSRSLFSFPDDGSLAHVARDETASALAPVLHSRAIAPAQACGTGRPATRHAHVEYVGALRRVSALEDVRRAIGKHRRFQHALCKIASLDDAELALLRPMA